MLQKKKETNCLSRHVSNAFVVFIIGPIYPKKSFEVKINCIKTTSIYKLIYNYNKMLLTSKCTIKTLNVNSTHWGGTERKRSWIHTFINHLTSQLFIQAWLIAQGKSESSLHVWIYAKTGGKHETFGFETFDLYSKGKRIVSPLTFLYITEPSFQTETKHVSKNSTDCYCLFFLHLHESKFSLLFYFFFFSADISAKGWSYIYSAKTNQQAHSIREGIFQWLRVRRSRWIRELLLGFQWPSK